MNFLSIKILWRFPFFSEKNKDEKKCIPFFCKGENLTNFQLKFHGDFRL